MALRTCFFVTTPNGLSMDKILFFTTCGLKVEILTCQKILRLRYYLFGITK